MISGTMKRFSFLLVLTILVAACQISEGKHLDVEVNETALKFQPLNTDLQGPEKDYLRELYAHFRTIFWPSSPPTRQFAVVTIEKLKIADMTHDHADDFPLAHPDQYNADFWSNSQPDHTEVVLLEHLSEMILDDLRAFKKMPKNVYLYTYNIPCPKCTTLIENFIERDFPNALNNFVHMNPHYAPALQQITQMTYRIGWTLEPNAEDAASTKHAFADINDDPATSHLAMYGKIKL